MILYQVRCGAFRFLAARRSNPASKESVAAGLTCKKKASSIVPDFLSSSGVAVDGVVHKIHVSTSRGATYGETFRTKSSPSSLGLGRASSWEKVAPKVPSMKEPLRGPESTVQAYQTRASCCAACHAR